MFFCEPRILSVEDHEAEEKPLISSKTQHCVEQLCAEGCQAVRAYIARLEQGKDIPQIAELKMEEKQEVLASLKDIMAVYDK